MKEKAGHDTVFGMRSGRVFFANGKPDGNP